MGASYRDELRRIKKASGNRGLKLVAETTARSSAKAAYWSKTAKGQEMVRKAAQRRLDGFY